MAAGTKLARGRITVINLNDGANAVVIYTRSQTQPATPTGTTPSGWNTVASTYDLSYGILWASSGLKKADGAIDGAWSTPIPVELYDSNLLRWAFTVGSGTQAPYTINGGTNTREIEVNPFAVNDVIWKGKSAISTGWCGGITQSSYPPTDHTKLYRFSCWFKRNTFSEGNLYFGLNGTVAQGVTWADSSNYYFWSNSPGANLTLLKNDQWFLVVGYVYPSTSDNAAVDVRSGIYDPITGQLILKSTAFCRQKSTVTSLGIRIAQYNCTTVDPELRLWQPRIDLCDGREPSIEELLKKNPLQPTVAITGTTVFKFASGQTVPTITSHTLIATLTNGLTNYQWQYFNGSSWTNFSSATTSGYALTYNHAAWGSAASLQVRCLSTLAGISYYSNELTITKVYDGTIGNWTSYVFQATATRPATPTGTATLPSGWVDSPTATGVWWMSKATINGSTGLAGTWSTPIQVTGINGTNGTDGKWTLYHFAKNTSTTTAPTTGWTTAPPTLSTGEYLWMRSGEVTPPATSPTTWNAAVRISGEKGATGDVGESITGKMLHRDPEFREGNNGCNVYNNLGNGNVVITRITKPTDCPTTSTHCLQITTSGVAEPPHGGYYQQATSRANAVFLVRVIAKIPVGCTLDTRHNSYGTGGTTVALTAMAGTGKYETYLFKITCGTSGTFSSVNHLYISGGSTPVMWYVASSTVYDMTDTEKCDDAIALAQKTVTFRGDFSASTAYYSTKYQRDCVKYSGSYYLFKGTNGTAAAWSASNWEAFGATFTSVATELLLAENATIAGFTFKNNRLESQGQYGGSPKLILNGTTGAIEAISGKIGGFSLAYDGMTSIDDVGTATNDAYVIVRRKKIVSGNGVAADKVGWRESRIGTNVLPSTSGTAGLGYFENSEQKGYYNPILNYNTYYSLSSFFTNYPAYEPKITGIAYSGDAWTDSSGYKRSIAIADNGITKQRITFTASKGGMYIRFEIKAYSEANYDYLLVGNLNSTALTRTTNYVDRVSGNGETKTVAIYIPTAGQHFVELAYAKDSSSNANGDYGLYRVVTQTMTWHEFRYSNDFPSFPYTYSDYYNSSAGQYELNYITVPYYTYEWVLEFWEVNRGLLLDVKNAAQNLAIDVLNGNAFFRRGSVVQWTNQYIGAAYTNTLEDNIGKTNIFVFSSISTSLLTVRLPAATHINNFSSGASSAVTFMFTIVIAATANTVRITSVTGGQLKNNNNGNVATYDLTMGDTMTLVYCNGCYYIGNISS